MTDHSAGVLTCVVAHLLATQLAAQPAPRRVVVDAGAHDRRDTPIVVALPGFVGRHVELGEDNRSRAIAAQLLPGDPPRLCFVLPGETKAGSKRTFWVRAVARATHRPSMSVADDGKSVHVAHAGRRVLSYRHAVVQPPAGSDPVFATSGYIHPILSAAGKVVSNDFPRTHLHHHGIWFPWRQTVFRGAPINFWESKAKQGRVECAGVDAVGDGAVLGWLRARHRHVALTPEKPTTVLHETWEVRVWAFAGYRLFDVDSVQRCATEDPLLIKKYRYGGFGFRGSRDWEGKGKACRFLTSEGKTRADGHATRANWCALYQKVDGDPAGVAIFCHPANFRAPQPMRIHPSEPFFNFTPGQIGDFAIEPKKPFASRYRFLVFDGDVDRAECERIWRGYAEPPRVKVVPGGG